MQRGCRAPTRPTMAAALSGLRGLLAAAGPAAGPARPRARPAPPGTRLLGQSCRRPAGPRAGPEPGSGGLPEGVEYIPTRKKGKNPMKPVGVAWAIGLPSGIILFLLAKREVDKNRLEQLKIRRKMMEANQGEYESERYKRVAGGA
uniref:PNKD metallo-beta-lactamase domain containing n=1 Tax=Aquila chrysaetos chrysaetos TaxID=223781 RepID=A0A663DS81_AQUCH